MKVVERFDKIGNSGTYLMGIDGSSSNTGISVISTDPVFGLIMRAFPDKDESPVRYKVELKKKLIEIFEKHPNITEVYYEEGRYRHN